MPSPIFISRPPPGFSFLSVIRGIQLTALGAIRALRNPYLVESGYYRRAFRAVVVSLIIQAVIWVPLGLLRSFFWFLSLFARHDEIIRIFENILDTLTFIQNNIFNIGPFFVTASRYFLPEMDEMFLMSLKFVDQVYKKKHPESHREYYSALILRPSNEKHKLSVLQQDPQNTPPPISAKPGKGLKKGSQTEQPQNAFTTIQTCVRSITSQISAATGFANDIRKNKPFQAFVLRSLTRAGISFALYILSFIPIVGRIVMPAVSFYSFNNVVGTPTAVAIFVGGYMTPRRWMIKFLGTFWGGRSLLRELLAPYFNRLPYSKADKEHWFRAREGIMFGFGAVFYLFIRTPFIGIVAYGIAEASTAYLITKVTEPPPPPPGVTLQSTSPAASGFTSLASANTTSSALYPSSAAIANPHHASPQTEENVVGSRTLDEKWMRRELSWTTSSKLLSGKSLDTDGFGTAPDIVPGAWASKSATNTAAELKQFADQHQGYTVSPSPSVSALRTPNPELVSEPGTRSSTPLATGISGSPRPYSPIHSASTNSPLASTSGYSGFSNYDKYNGYAKNHNGF